MSKQDLRRKSKKRAELLQTAEQLFVQKGIRALTVEEIVRQAQVSKATFYKHFYDKEDILGHVLQKIIDHKFDTISALVENGKRHGLSKENFLQLFDVNEHDRFFQADFLLELLQDYPHIVQMVQDQTQNNLMPLFRELIDMAKVHGIVRKEVDTDVLFLYAIYMRKAFRDNLQLPEQMSLKEFTRKFYDLFLYGIMDRT